jgi:predicted component of type VI protein secretion system
VLDERWSDAPRPGGRTADARRAIIAEAAWLLRFRGTVRGLKRFIELYVGVEVVILEKFRLRGLGGAVLGESGAYGNSVVGAGFRVGGAIGDTDAVTTATMPTADAFATHAHRFTVLIPAALTEEQLAVVHDILDVHRPAHTVVDVCTVGAGMRVGRGLHVALSSIVGPTGGFQTLQLGATALGRDAIVGRPSETTTVDASRLGTTTRVR